MRTHGQGRRPPRVHQQLQNTGRTELFERSHEPETISISGSGCSWQLCCCKWGKEPLKYLRGTAPSSRKSKSNPLLPVSNWPLRVTTDVPGRKRVIVPYTPMTACVPH